VDARREIAVRARGAIDRARHRSGGNSTVSRHCKIKSSDPMVRHRDVVKVVEARVAKALARLLARADLKLVDRREVVRKVEVLKADGVLIRIACLIALTPMATIN
jgi:hypothetical protein